MFYDVLKNVDLSELRRYTTQEDVCGSTSDNGHEAACGSGREVACDDAGETAQVVASDVSRATRDSIFHSTLNKDIININDLPALLQPINNEQLEQMAKRANYESISNFGRTIQLFTPLYLGNHCENQCIYCAFNQNYKVKRKTLGMDEVRSECEAIQSTDLDEVLLLTGESRKHTNVQYIAEAAQIAHEYFNSVAIEVYPMEVDEYKELIESGVSALTLYQETYDEAKYDALHLAGPKKDFRYRLDGPERGAQAGMHRIQIGALLGLSDPMEDAFKTALHMQYLMKHYPEVEWGLSLPRLKDIENGTFIGEEVPDRQFVQILLALRLVFPKVNISISTRESSEFREKLIPLGVNKLSAGVSTSVGRQNNDDEDTSQFEISDKSTVADVKAMVTNCGYQVVFRNWMKV